MESLHDCHKKQACNHAVSRSGVKDVTCGTGKTKVAYSKGEQGVSCRTALSAGKRPQSRGLWLATYAIRVAARMAAILLTYLFTPCSRVLLE